jgi:predicted CxxxxCH...CXXCH cytochrome family protein
MKESDLNVKRRSIRLMAILFILSLGFSDFTGCGKSNIADGIPDSDTPVSESMSCNTCHGNNENAAPPRSVDGSYDATAVTVGAHQSHLHDSAIKKALPCETCHTVPTDANVSQHINNTSAEISWGTLATATGLSPVWDRASGKCSSVYCHGATLSGGTNKKPSWTVVDGSQVACGTCHGNPPPAPHPQAAQCSACHPKTVNNDGTIKVNDDTHINGTVEVSMDDPMAGRYHPEGYASPDRHGYAFFKNKENCKGCHGSDYTGGTTGVSCDTCHGGSAWRTNCTFCHGGTDSDNGAPPRQVYVNTADLHTRHIENQGLSIIPCGYCHKSLDCAYCHVKPVSFDDAGHIDGVANVSISASSGINAKYDNATKTCSSVGCHSGNDVQWVVPEK